ncbi:uncharacterized protein DFL_003090 [Arthrobotrys flagrans]|uniref:Uncharacterized protein n=1 Tax=Arthrobotrys flagrans TaxID=97331 RepID=A0A437ACS7_ARTFL|nr:hypothetical protein DFL_003090 [Arthrobotrys flagrans]
MLWTRRKERTVPSQFPSLLTFYFKRHPNKKPNSTFFSGTGTFSARFDSTANFRQLTRGRLATNRGPSISAFEYLTAVCFHKIQPSS